MENSCWETLIQIKYNNTVLNYKPTRFQFTITPLRYPFSTLMLNNAIKENIKIHPKQCRQSTMQNIIKPGEPGMLLCVLDA